jgi:ABC-type iron transport system FetAB permease component
MKILGREPALILAAVAAVIQLLSAFLLPLSSGQQGVLNALAVAIVGMVASWVCRC